MTAEYESESFETIVRWVKRFAILGAVFGVFLMFGKETLIAESGRKPDYILWYWFWIPVMGIVGAFTGVGFGVIAVGWNKLREWTG